MAETETRIIKIEIDRTQALKDLESTEVALVNLKNEQKELNDSLKAGTITQNEYAASKVQLDSKIAKETESRKTLTQTINTESNSLAAQKLKLKELITERDKIDRSTVEGAKKFDQMNGSILQLNGSIKAAEAQGGSFQRNVGNYKGTIDQFTGGAYSAAQGLLSMTKAALAFIATPIGAIIAAVGLALAALMAYFKGSEEGQNRWNKIVTIGSTILEKLQDILEDVGEALFNAFANPKQAMTDLYEFLKTNLINRFTAFKVILDGILSLDIKKIGDGLIQAGTGIEDATGKIQNLAKGAKELFDVAIKEGGDLADMEAQYDRDNRERTVARSKRDLDVSLLRRAADEAEGAEKLKFLNQALDLEAQNVKAMVATATLARDIAKQKADLNGKDKQLKDDLAKADAALFDAQRGAFDETRKMNRERIATEKAIADEIMKRIDADQKLQFQEEQRVAIADEKATEELEKALERIEEKEAAQVEFAETMQLVDMEMLEAGKEVSDQDVYNFIKAEQKKREEAKKTKDFVIAMLNGTLQITSELLAGITDIHNMEAQNQIDALMLAAQKEQSILKESQDAQLKAIEDRHRQELVIGNEALFQREAANKKAFDEGLITEEEYLENKEKIAKEFEKQRATELKTQAGIITEIGKENAAAALEIETKRKRDEDDIKRKAFEDNKRNQIVQARIDQAQIILNYIRSVSGVPLIGAILAAAAAGVALGVTEGQIQKIKDSSYVGGSFSTGGYTGPGGVHDAAGVVHRGEVVWNQRDVAAVGGPMAANSMRPTYQGYAEGGIVANAMTNQIDQQYQNMSQAPRPYLLLTELNQAQNSLAQKVQIVEA